jgi:DNA-damage-inducible protein J
MKKAAVVRARIDKALKAQAERVLADCGLELSDAIRLFLRQVVMQRGIPFPIHEYGAVQYASGDQLRAIKRGAQIRDRAIAQREDLSGGEMLLIRPEQLRGARIKWPSVSLSD